MEKYESMNEILNDLVKINNDRIAGYDKAISESKDLDIDLKAIFERMIQESNQYKNELSDLILNNGGTVEDETTSAGKIYRAWQEIKSGFSANDRHSILEYCEFGEDAAQRAYESALHSDLLLDPAVHKIVEEEQASLKSAHDLIKKERDAHGKVKMQNS